MFDPEIDECLRRVVRDAIKNQDEITINLARVRTEKELGLDADFFKHDEKWKIRSKEIINAAVDESSSPEKPKLEPTPKAGTKRKSAEAQTGGKKAKKEPVFDSEDIAASDVAQAPPEPKSKDVEVTSKPQPGSEAESSLSSPPADDEGAELPNPNDNPDVNDESDLSSVIDDHPAPKKRRKKSAAPSTTAKAKPGKSTKPDKSESKASKPDQDLTPDEDEIKKLQSWLLKCGVRKLWHRELAPYPSPKDKIKHLKRMLDDVGMTGRFSAEKARQIKEARELAAELEAAKEFNEQWGHESGSGGEDEEGGNKREVTKRLKPKGLVDFGDSDEESE